MAVQKSKKKVKILNFKKKLKKKLNSFKEVKYSNKFKLNLFK